MAPDEFVPALEPGSSHLLEEPQGSPVETEVLGEGGGGIVTSQAMSALLQSSLHQSVLPSVSPASKLYYFFPFNKFWLLCIIVRGQFSTGYFCPQSERMKCIYPGSALMHVYVYKHNQLAAKR